MHTSTMMSNYGGTRGIIARSMRGYRKGECKKFRREEKKEVEWMETEDRSTTF